MIQHGYPSTDVSQTGNRFSNLDCVILSNPLSPLRTGGLCKEGTMIEFCLRQRLYFVGNVR
jgi:hypothetical protein